MSSGKPQVSGTVPPAARVPVDIAGPMGRGYLMLPCRHQRASLADPVSARAPYKRTCGSCKIRYLIEIEDPADGQEGFTAMITRLT
jgi:hypothetical protein